MGKLGVVYVLSVINSECIFMLFMEVSYSDGLKIWFNGKVVYEKQKIGLVVVWEEEWDIFLENIIQLFIQRGCNELFIKLEIVGIDWKVFLCFCFFKVLEG